MNHTKIATEIIKELKKQTFAFETAFDENDDVVNFDESNHGDPKTRSAVRQAPSPKVKI